MSTSSEQNSFVDQMKLVIADVENKHSLDEDGLRELDVCLALSSLLLLSRESTYPSAKEVVRAAGVMKMHEARRRLARQCLDVIAGRSQDELLDEARAKESLLFHAGNADMLVRLVRRAMLELGPRQSDDTTPT